MWYEQLFYAGGMACLLGILFWTMVSLIVMNRPGRLIRLIARQSHRQEELARPRVAP